MGLLSPSWTVCGVAAAVAFGGGVAGGLRWNAADLVRCEATRDGYARDLTAANDATEALREAGDTVRADLAKALEANATAAPAAEARVRIVMAKPPPSSCDQAFADWDAVPR